MLASSEQSAEGSKEYRSAADPSEEVDSVLKARLSVTHYPAIFYRTTDMILGHFSCPTSYRAGLCMPT